MSSIKYIEIKSKQFRLDDEDYELISGFNWHLDTFGYPKYRDNSLGKTWSIHRMLLNPPDGMVVDHIDGDIYNNQKANLRVCTMQENLYNRKKQDFTSSEYKGVCWNKRDRKWRAYLNHKGKRISLGSYEKEKEAAEAYNTKALELFGEYARLN